MQKSRSLPEWLKMQRASGENYSRVKRLVSENHLNTICTSGNCPNIGECWNSGTATFMILGNICTRACKFCATVTGRPLPPDPEEPGRLALAVKTLRLRHCVITSVDRDDLDDRGSGSWAMTIRYIKEVNPGTTIEALIPDFDGREKFIRNVINEEPEVISHNVETVRRLTPAIRTKARYETSLGVLRTVAESNIRTKSGFMLGLGEEEKEILETMEDILYTGCRILTIGQYLRPAPDHMRPAGYILPAKFEEYREAGLGMGFEIVESSPLVRSSFHAEKHIIA